MGIHDRVGARILAHAVIIARCQGSGEPAPIGDWTIARFLSVETYNSSSWCAKVMESWDAPDIAPCDLKN